MNSILIYSIVSYEIEVGFLVLVPSKEIKNLCKSQIILHNSRTRNQSICNQSKASVSAGFI